MKDYLKIVPVAITFLMIGFFIPAGFGQNEAVKGNVCFAGHVDISSPWSGGYIYENFTAVGRVEINDSFSMNNLGPGTKSGSDEKTNFSPAVVKSAPETVTGVVYEKENNPGSDLASVLGVSIIAVPSWFDLF